MDNRRVAGAQRILEQELEGLVPVVALCGAGTEGGGAQAPFFQGEPDTHAAGLHLFAARRLARAAADSGDLRRFPAPTAAVSAWWSTRSPITGPAGAGRFCLGSGQVSAADRPGPNSFVLADKLAFCRFAYLDQPPDGNVPCAGFRASPALLAAGRAHRNGAAGPGPVAPAADQHHGPDPRHRSPEIAYGDY